VGRDQIALFARPPQHMHALHVGCTFLLCECMAHSPAGHTVCTMLQRKPAQTIFCWCVRLSSTGICSR
jgi:hypothetical protein